MNSDVEEQLLARIKSLSEILWEGRCTQPDIDQWLSNFVGRHYGDADEERLHALHLLSSVSYFGLPELRVLLRSLFRNLFRYPIIQEIREDLGNTRDSQEIAQLFKAELESTRFLGVGSPAESGTHLLYYFRQENKLPRHLFVGQHEILTAGFRGTGTNFVPSNLKRLVFIDDLCGSGEQAVRYSRTLLNDLRAVASSLGRTIEFQYLVLFGTADGLAHARKYASFDVVDAVFEIDDTDATYSADSRVFRKPPIGIDKAKSKAIASGYGQDLWPGNALGWDDGQLLLAFHHNVPDNTLPIIWFDEAISTWSPAFARYPKVEG
jgi:hypothetical protein